MSCAAEPLATEFKTKGKARMRQGGESLQTDPGGSKRRPGTLGAEGAQAKQGHPRLRKAILGQRTKLRQQVFNHRVEPPLLLCFLLLGFNDDA